MANDAAAAAGKSHFLKQYGPWAVISGASDGTGAAYAKQLAEAGLNLVLIARRLDPLNGLAAELQAEYGIQTRVASIDLYELGAGQQVLAAADGLEVGLYVSNAGADPNGKRFLDVPFDVWRGLINRNVMALAEAVYGFAGPMKARGRGGLIMMSSGAGLGGASGVAVYSSTKAFDLNLAESLWIELKPSGVNVISAIAPAMDTPSLRKILNGREIPGVHDPVSVARTIIERLGDGPCYDFGLDPVASAQLVDTRRKRVEMVSEMTKMFIGDH